MTTTSRTREIVGLYAIRVEPHGRKREGHWALVALSRPETAWAQAIAIASANRDATVTLIEMETQEAEAED